MRIARLEMQKTTYNPLKNSGSVHEGSTTFLATDGYVIELVPPLLYVSHPDRPEFRGVYGIHEMKYAVEAAEPAPAAPVPAPLPDEPTRPSTPIAKSAAATVPTPKESPTASTVSTPKGKKP